MCMRYGVPSEQESQICPYCKGPLESSKSRWFTCKKCHRSFDVGKLVAEHARKEREFEVTNS